MWYGRGCLLLHWLLCPVITADRSLEQVLLRQGLSEAEDTVEGRAVVHVFDPK